MHVRTILSNCLEELGKQTECFLSPRNIFMSSNPQELGMRNIPLFCLVSKLKRFCLSLGCAKPKWMLCGCSSALLWVTDMTWQMTSSSWNTPISQGSSIPSVTAAIVLPFRKVHQNKSKLMFFIGIATFIAIVEKLQKKIIRKSKLFLILKS